ncbi:hypothetical protein P7K49_018960 [Saguinus oedipus]|uniref:Uncharacterized protein n=1 Tax=Saguinus oedipus TaxID=9490 RepID=A0ABQ9UVZ2_SAGOE|nr:hypothetical protein P7K49_018960 [Saguinus oedipus]
MTLKVKETTSNQLNFKTLADQQGKIDRADATKITADVVESGRTSGTSNNPKLSELMQLQVAECLPRANHCDICKRWKKSV